jgi:hypothetical protein
VPLRNAKPASPGTLKSSSALPGLPSIFRTTATGTFRRIDTGTLRRIRDTATIRAIMDTGTMRAIMDTAAIQVLRDRLAGKSKVVASVVIAFWCVMAVVLLATVWLHGSGTSVSGASQRPSATTPAAARASQAPGSRRPDGSTTGRTSQVRVLPVASVVAVGPNGAVDGDNPGSAANVIDGRASRSWQTKWYKSAHFGLLKPGTGLLLDMDTTTVVSSVRLRLAPGSADVEILVGYSESRLAVAATRDAAGGTVDVLLAKPATGRYVEVWFTALPKTPAGTYQETVYGVQVSGRS